MADSNRTTLVVALAGIAATALVGLAGTGAAWVSARDDRAAQRSLARDERTYDRRVSVYLDAIDFAEGQKATLHRWLDPGLVVGKTDRKILFRADPPDRLASRLRAFGSPQAFAAFQETEKLAIPETALLVDDAGREFLVEDPDTHWARNLRGYNRFKAQLLRFEDAIHHEVG